MMTTPLPSMNQARYRHAAAIADNKLFVIGGSGLAGAGPPGLDTIEVLDLANLHDLESPPEWRVLDARLAPPRQKCAAVVVEDEIYIIGGWHGYVTVMSSVQVLNGMAETLSQGPPLIAARAGCAACLIGSSIVAAGGHAFVDRVFTTVESAECLHVDENAPQWQPLEPSSLWGLFCGAWPQWSYHRLGSFVSCLDKTFRHPPTRKNFWRSCDAWI